MMRISLVGILLGAGTQLFACGTGGTFTTSVDASSVGSDVDPTMSDTSEDSGVEDAGDDPDGTPAADVEPETVQLDSGEPDIGFEDTDGADAIDSGSADTPIGADSGPEPSVLGTALYTVSGGGLVRSANHVGRIAVGGPHPRASVSSPGHRARIGVP